MGTRNLTMVYSAGKMKIAQYGQWDGYPSGQGLTVAKFVRDVLLKPEKREAFMKQLDRVRFIDDAKQKEIKAFLKSLGCKDGWMNMNQAAQYHKKYPLLTRDNGAEILFLIHKAKGKRPLWVGDSTEFAGESLSNEWSYLINLDTNELELYKGFNKAPLGRGQRFKYMESQLKAEWKAEGRTPDYYPVKCYGKIPMTVDEFPVDDKEFLTMVNSMLPKQYRQ